MKKLTKILLIGLVLLLAITLAIYWFYMKPKLENISKSYNRDTTKISYNFEKTGILSIQSSPSDSKAVISSLDNSFIKDEELPVEPLELPEGKYLVTVYQDGFESYQEKIALKQGETKSISARLKLLPEPELKEKN